MNSSPSEMLPILQKIVQSFGYRNSASDFTADSTATAFSMEQQGAGACSDAKLTVQYDQRSGKINVIGEPNLDNEKNVKFGTSVYKITDLKEAFDEFLDPVKTRGARDWKEPIDAFVPVDKLHICAAACQFYTATELLIHAPIRIDRLMIDTEQSSGRVGVPLEHLPRLKDDALNAYREAFEIRGSTVKMSRIVNVKALGYRMGEAGDH